MSTLKLDKITGRLGVGGDVSPITLSGDTATLGSGSTFSGTIGTGTTFHQNIQPAFSFYNNGSNQNLSGTDTWNKIQFNQADLDTVTGFNDSEDRYEFQVAGYYFIIAQIQYGGGINSSTAIYGGIYFYDTSASSGSHYTSVTSAENFAGGDNFNQCIHAVVNASVGDYVYVETQRSQSDTINVMHGTDRNTIFSGFKILS